MRKDNRNMIIEDRTQRPPVHLTGLKMSSLNHMRKENGNTMIEGPTAAASRSPFWASLKNIKPQGPWSYEKRKKKQDNRSPHSAVSRSLSMLSLGMRTANPAANKLWLYANFMHPPGCLTRHGKYERDLHQAFLWQVFHQREVEVG